MKGAVVSALAVILIVGAAVVGVTATTHPTKGPSHPDQWDPRVLDIVKFDEQHRGLTFKHPVQVDFLSPDEYSKRARSQPGEQTEQEKKDEQTTAGELRAVGLAPADVDLFSAGNDLADDGTLAFYDPDTQRVSVRGSDMTPELRVTLAHELTHALQDQYFDISSRRTDKFKTDGEDSAFRALIEGDATRIEDEYVDSMSKDDQNAYDQANANSVSDARTALNNVPVSLQAFQQAPYIDGPPFADMLAADGGNKAVDDAMRTPPTTEEQLFDPSKFLDHDGAKDVSRPTLPAEVKDSTDDGDFGVTTLYLMLAERIDPLRALKAVDGWGGDSYVTYDYDGKTCMRVAFVGDNSQEQDELFGALGQWEQQMPQGAVDLSRDDKGINVQVCEAGATPTGRSLDAIEVVGLRSQEAAAAVQYGHFPLDKGIEFGNCVVQALGFSWVQQIDQANGPDGIPQSLLAQREQAEQTCIDQIH